jgi:signal transduction histidine kinase
VSATLTVRTRFMLVVVLGVVLPMGVVGGWLVRSSRRSGETLLRSRLTEALGEAVEAVGATWVDRRSEILRLVENQEVVAALRSERALSSDSAHHPVQQLGHDWSVLEPVVSRATFRDVSGTARTTLAREARGLPASEGPAGTSSVTTSLPVFDDTSGTEVGSVDVDVKLNALLPSRFWWSGVGGSVLALFDSTGRVPLLPLSVDPSLLRKDRFSWSGEEWLVVTKRVHEPPIVFALAAPLGPFATPFERAARNGALSLVVVLAGALMLAFVMTRRITGPLEELVLASDAVTSGQLGRLVTEGGPSEIRRLSRAFNTMTESLTRTMQRLSQREAVAAVGEFAASLAHEVRNPITSIRLDLERAVEKLSGHQHAGLVERALREIDRLDATVTGSLRIARTGDLTLSTLDVLAPLGDAMRASRPAFDQRGAVLDPLTTQSEPVLVRGHHAALEQLFLNLLLNAAEALGAQQHARVRVEVTAASVCLTIEDEGVGISPELLGRVLEPFYTTKEGGTGLGLAIATRIARAHGGEIQLESSAGTGTTVRVRLPAIA